MMTTVRAAARRARDLARSTGSVTVERGPASGLRLGRRYASADYRLGTNEGPLQQALVEHLSTGDVFYDIGSNVGFFTLIGARLVGREGSVHAFEALAGCARALRRNVARNDFANVTVHECAVGAHVGDVPLMVSRHPGGATISVADRPHNEVRTVTVHVTTLDAVVAAGAPMPDLVKIDVEGAELDVLRGAGDVLQRARPTVIYEVDDADHDRARAKAASLADHLRERGYETQPLEASYGGSRSLVLHHLAVAR